MQEESSATGLSHAKWDIGLIGKTVDDRGTAATDFIVNNCATTIVLKYDPDEFELDCGESRIPIDEFRNRKPDWSNKSLILEASTLGFAEILLCCAKLRDLAMPADILYVEPALYKLSGRTALLHKRDFDLSDEVPGYRGIPGFTLLLDQSAKLTAVCFLGYEERRLDRALEDFDFLRPDSCCVVFGVPAFRPGWEMNAFANNIRVIRERDLRGGVHFCGAENPLAAFQVLDLIKRGMTSVDRMLIAPIGTKPCGIGTALFAVDNPTVGILYDHPQRSEKRSEQVGNWHLYSVSFS